jgi:hypothetical protein
VGGLYDDDETIGDEKIPAPAAFCAAILKSYETFEAGTGTTAVVDAEFVLYVYHVLLGGDVVL